MKIVDSIWFTEMGEHRPIGIILVENELTGERKAYIGKSTLSESKKTEEHDSKLIIDVGAKIHVHTVARLLRFLEGQ
jgi:hypothetical protein